jgi:hypothetical protein
VTHILNGERIDRILEIIVEHKKDVPANTEASLKWLKQQPDFDDRMPYYINKWFGKFFPSIGSIMPCNAALYTGTHRRI